jgi:hypothetical protein
MSKRKNNRPSILAEQVASIRRSAHAAYVADLREGRKPNRATTFADRKKVADRRACRGRVIGD